MDKDRFVLKQGDCHELLKELESNSVDLVLCDPPYGNCNGIVGVDGWDNHLSWELVFDELLRVCKYPSNILLFAQDHLTIKLIRNDHNNIKYCHRLIWDKGKNANHLGASKNPLNHTEDILVFRKQYSTDYSSRIRNYARLILAHIGKTSKEIERDFGDMTADHFFRTETTQHTICSEGCYSRLISMYNIDKMEGFLPYQELKNLGECGSNVFNVPTGWSYVPNIFKGRDSRGVKHHPTEKPVGLLEQLISIYSNEEGLVLDFTMGSGSTGVACKNTGRRFVGFEQDKDFFAIAERRINQQELF